MLTFIDKFIEKVKGGFLSLFSRFPFTLTYIFCLFSLFVYLIEGNNIGEKKGFILSMVILLFGLLSISSLIVSLLFEKKYIYKLNIFIFQFINLIIIGSIWGLLVLPDIIAYDMIKGIFTSNMYRLIMLFFILIISGFIIPFIKDKGSDDFWSFGVGTIFAGFVGIIYGNVVYLGLGLALFAIDSFWTITFSDNQYATLSVFAFFLVAPINFLKNIPIDIVKIRFFELPAFAFTLIKFVLLPLIIIYSLIIYPYIASFPFRNEWPSNQSTIIIAGLLSLVYGGILLFNGLDKDGVHKKFINFYTRVFSLLTLPAIIFWVYSLYLRINAYGLTINRFFLMCIIFWSFGVGLYYGFSKFNDIKKVILSFILLLIFVFYFPFSGFFWSNRSQYSRIIDMAENKGMIKDGKMYKFNGRLSYDDNKFFNEVFYYLNANRGLHLIKDNLSEELLEEIKLDKYDYSSALQSEYSTDIKFAQEVDNYPYGKSNYKYIMIQVSNNVEINIPKGYSKFSRIYNYKGDNEKYFKYISSNYLFDSSAAYLTQLDISSYQITDSSKLIFDIDGKKLQLINIEGYLRDDNKIDIEMLEGYLFEK